MKKAPQTEKLLPNGTRIVFFNSSRMVVKGTIMQSYYRVKSDRGTFTYVACANAAPENQDKPGFFARIWKAVRNDYVR